MRTHLLIATVLAFAANGCIVEHDYVREPSPGARYQEPPAPPPDDGDASAGVSAPPVERNVDTQVFYDRLSGYGSWEYTPEYGRVWVPSVGANWRPYYYGNWELTDWGWTFASADPWGWAAYHYGSWGYGPGLGWYWVPGSVWAPAWVSWRYGGGYVSWCPIGPAGYAYGYNSPGWVAVGEQHFTQPIATAAVPVHATAGIVQGSTPLAGPHATPVKGGSFGPPVAQVAAATGQQFHPVSAASVVNRPMARPMASNSDGYRRAGSDPIRSPAPRAAAGSPGQAIAAQAPRSAGGGAYGAPAARGLGRPSSNTAAPRGLGSGGAQPRGLGYGGGAQPRGLGYGGGAQPRGLGSGGARSGSSGPRPSGGGLGSGGGYRPSAQPRGSGGGGGGYHPSASPAPSARPSGGGGGGGHSRK